MGELQKRRRTRRSSVSDVYILRKNQEKSAVHAIRWSDDEYLSDNSMDDSEFNLSENMQSKRVRQDTFAETVVTEQEWADFDEIMTDDSLGIRLQAQLLMERKLILREQRVRMREKIKKQKVIKHSVSVPDIPYSESTIDELYASVNDKQRSMTRESLILSELQNINKEIDKELNSMKNGKSKPLKIK